MSQTPNGKFSHTRSLSELPHSVLAQEALLLQSQQKAAALMGFSTPKVNKNRYRLKPLASKKTRANEEESSPIETTRFQRTEKKSLSIVTDNTFSHDASTPLGSQSALSSSSKLSKNFGSATAKNENRIFGHNRSGSETRLLVNPDRQNFNSQNSSSASKNRLTPIIEGNPEERVVVRVSMDNKEKFKSVKELIASNSRVSVREDVVPIKVISAFDSFRHLIFQPHIQQEALKKYASLVLRGLNYSINLLRPPPLEFIKTRQFTIPEYNRDKSFKTLLLDLDETLIHTNSEMQDPDKLLPIPGDHTNPPIRLKIRPHARKFLRMLKDHYEIFVFTAACPAYAQLMAKELDPENKIFSYVLDRTYCLETRNGLYIKDLRIIKNRELKNMIIVDNLVHSFGFQVDNGVPILEWKGDKEDEELKYLANYLLEAKKSDDIREFNKEKLRLSELVNSKLDDPSP